MLEKLKYILQDDRRFYFFVVIFLLIGAFVLGRLSVQVTVSNSNDQLSSVVMSHRSESVDIFTIPKSAANENSVYASIHGERYYTLSCRAGDRIKVENRLYFSTVNHALAAGYTPSSQCVFP